MDFAAARRRMVDGQLKPNRVTDPRILLAFEELPRERFVPAALTVRALSDEDVPLGKGRFLLQPMSLAKLIQLATPRAGERALVAASGTGYGAAVLACLGLEVTALEDDPALLAIAGPALAAAGLPPGAVRQREADPAAPDVAEGPFDVILVEGAVPEVPRGLALLLAEGGRLVAVRRTATGPGAAIIARRAAGSISTVEAFDCRTPLLPAFAPKPGFAFA